MNEIINCLLRHKSIRKFKSKPIESEKLDLIVKAGTRAATAGNLQMYTILIIEDDEKKRELDQAWNSNFIEISKCPVVIVTLADQYRVKRWLQLHSEREICNNGPHHFFLSIWDALIALQNMVVAAESIGLGTCYFGSILELDIQDILCAPKYVFPAGLVCIGYPDESSELSMRLPMDAVVHKNTYRIPRDEDIIKWYEERDNVWNTVSDKLKEKLKKQNIYGIAQALAVQKYSKEVIEKRSKGILENLKNAGFDLTVST